jgi:hypothetical protein
MRINWVEEENRSENREYGVEKDGNLRKVLIYCT